MVQDSPEQQQVVRKLQPAAHQVAEVFRHKLLHHVQHRVRLKAGPATLQVIMCRAPIQGPHTTGAVARLRQQHVRQVQLQGNQQAVVQDHIVSLLPAGAVAVQHIGVLPRNLPSVAAVQLQGQPKPVAVLLQQALHKRAAVAVHALILRQGAAAAVRAALRIRAARQGRPGLHIQDHQAQAHQEEVPVHRVHQVHRATGAKLIRV